MPVVMLIVPTMSVAVDSDTVGEVPAPGPAVIAGGAIVPDDPSGLLVDSIGIRCVIFTPSKAWDMSKVIKG